MQQTPAPAVIAPKTTPLLTSKDMATVWFLMYTLHVGLKQSTLGELLFQAMVPHHHLGTVECQTHTMIKHMMGYLVSSCVHYQILDL